MAIFYFCETKKNRKNIMNCSLKNLHKSLKICVFEYGSEQRTNFIINNLI